VNLPELCIRRPVFATVLSLVLVLLGYIAYGRLTVREYPRIDEPVISVETRYTGASAQIMESEVTTPIEDALAGIEGVKLITSVSREESSQINIKFSLARDIESAAADVRDRVSRVRDVLPDDVDEPIIGKVEADSQPIIWLAFYSDRHSLADITDYVDRYVQDDLQRVPGVAEARIYGERRYAMRVWLDTAKLAGQGITPQDVETAIRAQNLEVPAGRIESDAREFTVRSETGLNRPEQFDDLIIANRGGYLVRLSDVGTTELGVETERVHTRYRGNPAIALGIVRQSIANPVEISQAVRARLPQIQDRLPPGMNIEVAYDSSVFIERSIASVYETIAEAVALVVLVILLFLRSWRSMLIPVVTIPVSLIASFFFMWLLGFSVNTLSLLAMVLAIGLVVDDAIVMLENIYRHIEDGMAPIPAALKGAREISFAVVAMTLTLAAVYVPIAFMQGRTGRLFTEFALTLAGAVLISGFVALTLTPMMCSRMLRHGAGEGPIGRWVGRGLDTLERGYRRALTWTLNHREVPVLVALFVAIGCWQVYGALRSELAPLEDRGAILGIMIAPEGATVDYTDAYAKQIEQIYAGVPDAERYFVATGFPTATQAFSFLGLKPWEERERSTTQVAASIGGPMFGVPGVLAFPITPASLGASPFGKPVEFVIRDSRDYDEIAKTVDAFLAELRKEPRLLALDTDLKINTPQLLVQVNRELVGDLGLDVATIGRTIETMVGGRTVTKFKRDGQQYDVIVQLRENERANPDDLTRVFVRTPAGDMVPLSSLISIEEITAPRDLNHFNRTRAVKVTATLAPGYTLGEALSFMEATAAQVLPPSATVDYDGQSLEFRESSGELYVTFLLALGFIYLVLAAQFESFIDPLVILLTVPLSMLGALLALQLTGNTLNIYSQIGLVTLVGLITKHGILIVEFANQLQLRGMSKRDAVIEAATLRLRPILMTTGAMVLGAVPLAIAVGAGAESRHQLGWVIVGGLGLGSLLTVFIVPTAYTLIARTRTPRSEIDATRAPAPAGAAPAE
jgi:multidrug efflux pump